MSEIVRFFGSMRLLSHCTIPSAADFLTELDFSGIAFQHDIAQQCNQHPAWSKDDLSLVGG